MPQHARMDVMAVGDHGIWSGVGLSKGLSSSPVGPQYWSESSSCVTAHLPGYVGNNHLANNRCRHGKELGSQ